MVHIKKILKTFLSFCVSIPLLITGVYSENDSSENNKSVSKAIIFVPGVLSSGLFYNGESNLKYYKNESLWIGITPESKVRSLKAVSKFLVYYKDLFCDENGIPADKNIGLSKNLQYVYESDSKIIKFGILNLCEKLICELNKKFSIKNGGECEVVFHNYDWRIDCAESSKLLTQEIMKYDEVILIGYSMGGLVSCKSAAELMEKNELQRIKAFISVAVPYNGSADSLYLLEKGLFTKRSFMEKMAENIGISGIISELSHNCIPTYELLPCKKYFEKSENGFVCVEKDKSLSYDESIKFLKSREWAKKSNGFNKDFFKKSENFHKSLYIDGKHIVNFMNSHFIAGNGIKTISRLFIDKDSKGSAVAVNYVDGDGTVALNESAVPSGKTMADLTKVCCSHTEILSDDLAIKNIINIIYNNIRQDEKAATPAIHLE